MNSTQSMRSMSSSTVSLETRIFVIAFPVTWFARVMSSSCRRRDRYQYFSVIVYSSTSFVINATDTLFGVRTSRVTVQQRFETVHPQMLTTKRKIDRLTAYAVARVAASQPLHALRVVLHTTCLFLSTDTLFYSCSCDYRRLVYFVFACVSLLSVYRLSRVPRTHGANVCFFISNNIRMSFSTVHRQ